MARNWTTSQKDAIEKEGSVLVSASAGTGKTAVLTEKVSNEISKKGHDISNLLVVTFSSAAADEMKDRIRKQLRECATDRENYSNDTRAFIWSQIRKFNTANIQTIHAFCNTIVKTYFYKLGLDLNMNIADNFDVSVLKYETISEILNDKYFIQSPYFTALEEYIDGTDTIENVFISAYDKIMSFIDPMEWLNDAVEAYHISENKVPKYIADMLIYDFQTAADNMQKGLDELKEIGNDKTEKIVIAMATDINILNNIITELKAGHVDAITSTSLSEFAPTVRFPAKDDSYDNVKFLRNMAKDDIIAKYKKTGFDLPSQISRIREMYNIALEFKDIIVKFDEIYTAKKKENHVIDFSDMEKYAYEILKDDTIAYEFSSKYAKVFVDEYQDTSPIQEAIIRRISREDNLFCAGDLKQSIYRFRSSDPILFQERSSDYQNKKASGSVIFLNNNFRSAQNILDCANDVFYHITKTSKEIEYSDNDKLVHSRLDDNSISPVEVNLISDDIKMLFPTLTSEEIEIYNMVNIIKNQIGQPIFDQELNDYRPTEYKDIVILCRKLSGYSDYMAQIFTANEIPFFIEKSGELLETQEIQVLMNLIDLIDNTQNDLKIMSIIHAGLFGFTDEDLVSIRKKDIMKSYYDIMLAEKSNESELGAKCEKFFNFLADCKNQEQYRSLSDMIDYILRQTNFNDYFAVSSNGKNRIANIKLFKKYAFDFENKSNENLHGFMDYIRNISESGQNIDEAKVNYTDNSVRVTTIHKSKGLEYPVVILGFMNKAFSSIDKRANIIIDKDAGLGLRYFDFLGRAKGKSLHRTYVERMVSEKNKEEEMRLLYVAMTRAKERLYVQALVPTTSADFNNLIQANSMMDWILSTLTQSGKAKEIFDFQEATKLNIKLNGDWKLLHVNPEDIAQYLNNTHVEITNEDFLNEFNLPYTKSLLGEEETVENVVTPVAISSSKITGTFNTDIGELDFEMPDFDTSSNSKKTASKGTITHTFMRNLDFKADLSVAGLKTQLASQIEKQFISEDEAESIDLNNIAKFFNTDGGLLIKTSDKDIREKGMNIMKTASSLGLNESNDEVLVRCIADLIVEKDGKYYLIDYKTDKITNPDDEMEVNARVESHKSQLVVYAEAFTKIYNHPVEDILVVFLDAGIYRKIS